MPHSIVVDLVPEGGTFSFKIEWLELLVGDSAGFDMGTEYAHLL